MRKQRDLIEKQKEQQVQMMIAKKEEALKAAEDKVIEAGDRMNVLNIDVEDDFDVDDI